MRILQGKERTMDPEALAEANRQLDHIMTQVRCTVDNYWYYDDMAEKALKALIAGFALHVAEHREVIADVREIMIVSLDS